jgi:hypothetical protein
MSNLLSRRVSAGAAFLSSLATARLAGVTASRRVARRSLALSTVALAGIALAATPAFASLHAFSTSFGSFGPGDGQVSLASNSGVAVNATTHDVYVADTGNARIDQFSSSGAFIRAWGWGVADGSTAALQTCTSGCNAGLPGAGAGQFTSPTFVAVDNSIGLSQGDVYVGDAATNTVSKFSASGAYISTIDGSSATAPVAGPFGPLAGVTVDGSGDLWVYDANANMFEFAQDSSFITSWNSGRGVRTNGIDVDSAGNLYVLTGGGSVEQFTPSGGDVGPVNGDAQDPIGLAVNRSSNEIYMDSGGSLIRRYASSCDAGGRCTAAEGFGAGQLSSAAGIGVDSSSDTAFVSDSSTQTISLFTVFVPSPPAIDGTSVANVTSTAADLRAVVNPQAADTTYHFQYGASTAYGQSTPESSSIGADLSDHSITSHIQGLTANTTYHFRVVASNSAAPGGVDGPDHSFTTQPSASAFALPDNRRYELVTPAVRGNGSLLPSGDGLYAFGGGYQASSSGDKLAYLSVTPFPGSTAGGVENYLASRGAGGWSSQDLSPREAPAHGLLDFPKIDAFSPDLSKATLAIGGGSTGVVFLGQDDPPLVSGEPANNKNLFLRDNTNASYQLMNVTPAGVTPAGTNFGGASQNLSHVVFDSVAQLTPGALGGGVSNLYQWVGGTVSLVSQIPVAPGVHCGSGGSACTAAQAAGLGTAQPLDASALNAVSLDGSKIFFTNRAEAADQTDRLYMRENGTSTTEISASQKTNGTGPGGTDANGPQSAFYFPAAADGSKAFFASCEQLTNDSTAVHPGQSGSSCDEPPNQQGWDLYSYDTARGSLSDLSVDRHGDPLGADVQGILGSSTDGSYVYFVANGVLARGASLGDCTVVPQTTGQCNLYLAHDGTTTFIARLDSDGDNSDWTVEIGNYRFTARVTPDGTRLAFESRLSLTGYDNNVATGGTCAQGTYHESVPSPHCQEVYLYDARSGQLRCASCNPSGPQPLGPSSLTSAGEHGLTGNAPFDYMQRNLSDDGRLFFDSADALTPGDINGKVDVYEYTAGRPYLISSGTDSNDSTFIDASSSGNDVFFDTGAQLVGQEPDQRSDIYDARVGGGFPFSPPGDVPCIGESCRAALSGAWSAPTLASVWFTGSGNDAVSGPVAPSTVKILSKGGQGARFFLRVRVSATGRVTVSGSRVKAAERAFAKAGTYELPVVLTARARSELRAKHKLRLRLRVGFAPATGGSSSVVVSLTVKA